MDKLNAQNLPLKTYKLCEYFYRIQKKSLVCEQLFIQIFIVTKAIPLGAEDSLLTRTVLNEKNKMLLHHFYLRGKLTTLSECAEMKLKTYFAGTSIEASKQKMDIIDTTLQISWEQQLNSPELSQTDSYWIQDNRK